MFVAMRPKEELENDTGQLYGLIWEELHALEWGAGGFFESLGIPYEAETFEGSRCLDAGCGTGRASHEMLRLGAATVVGIDIGERSLHTTAERNREFGDRLELHQASILEIPFPDETFDVVTSLGIIHHSADPAKAFREFVRVAKPGGKILVGVYGRGGVTNLLIDMARLLRHVIPKQLTLGLCRLLRMSPQFTYVVLDCMYVPIRKAYSERGFRQWFVDAGLVGIQRFNPGPNARWFQRFLRGEGFLTFVGEKPAAPSDSPVK